MAIETIQQIVEVTAVDMLTTTDPTLDTVNSVYVREIRAYGPDNGLGTRPLIFTLRVSGADATKIALSAPAQTF